MMPHGLEMTGMQEKTETIRRATVMRNPMS